MEIVSNCGICLSDSSAQDISKCIICGISICKSCINPVHLESTKCQSILSEHIEQLWNNVILYCTKKTMLLPPIIEFEQFTGLVNFRQTFINIRHKQYIHVEQFDICICRIAEYYIVRRLHFDQVRFFIMGTLKNDVGIIDNWFPIIKPTLTLLNHLIHLIVSTKNPFSLLDCENDINESYDRNYFKKTVGYNHTGDSLYSIENYDYTNNKHIYTLRSPPIKRHNDLYDNLSKQESDDISKQLKQPFSIIDDYQDSSIDGNSSSIRLRHDRFKKRKNKSIDSILTCSNNQSLNDNDKTEQDLLDYALKMSLQEQ